MTANVHTMRPSPRFPRLHAALPDVSVVRRPSDSAAREDADPAVGMHQAQAGNAGRVDGVGPQRSGITSAGKRKSTRARTDWPGREYGIRAPHPSETALSWSEVFVFLEIGATNV